MAQGPSPAAKVSSLLDLQLKEKTRLLGTATPRAAGTASPLGTAAPDVSKQKIFLHLRQFPTPARMNELRALGVTLYPDSWIPPTGKHPTGFMLAEAPVSRIGELAAKDYVTLLQTAEMRSQPKNDQAAVAMAVNNVWTSGYTGAGIKVAVLDSGLDVSHPDIPASLEKADYSNYPGAITYGSVANTVFDHGTHVTGSAVGRGTQSSAGTYVYKGTAPAASLVFLKIGNSSTADASSAAQVKAIRDAVDVYNAKVITMSYGSWSTHHDGTGEISQAVDYAAGKGAVFFGAAGNEALVGQHYSGTVSPGSYSDWIKVNASGAGVNTAFLAFNLVWFDGPGVRNDLSLEYFTSNNNNPGSQLTTINSSAPAESSKGTESQFSKNTVALPAGSSAWYLRVKNPSTNTQFFHIYYDAQWNLGGGNVVFENPDPLYTLSDPAEADGAIAVGAYVSRVSWTDYSNNTWSSGQSPSVIAPFSSRGPRVDAAAPGKPNVVAPGSMIISLRDRDVYPSLPGMNPGYLISNSGVNNGQGPADYIVKQGTSMASPLAAGVGALLLQKRPSLTPGQVRTYLETTAVDKGAGGWDNTYGWGLVSAQAAINAIPTASFTRSLNPENGMAPVTATFTDTSTGNLTSWSWNFGDGAGSSSQNPTKLYTAPGNYTVTLTVGNAVSSHTASQTVGVYGTPVASFSSVLNPPGGAAPVAATLTDTSTGNPTSWSWNFGDGTGSSSQNPSKTFTSGGNFTVTLTVSNPLGVNSASTTVQVYSTPVAAFSAAVTTNSPGSPIAFTDQSLGNITAWSWNFGDGTTSSSKNPSKNYGAEGTYNVTLTATNPLGTNILTRPGYITIVAFKSETEISQGIDSSGFVYVAGKIKRVFDPNTSGTVNIGDGIGAYDAYISYPAGAVSVKAASGKAPFSSPTVAWNILGGTRSTASASQTGSIAQPPLELFKFYPWLVGSKDNFSTLTLHFNGITRAAGGEIPQGADASRNFRRGDADNNGTVNIIDALLIAQYLAGLRSAGEGPGEIWPVNSATPRNDSTTEGSSITITDALYIAQMLAGIRDGSYN